MLAILPLFIVYISPPVFDGKQNITGQTLSNGVSVNGKIE